MYIYTYLSLFTELLHANTFYWETENKQVKQSRVVSTTEKNESGLRGMGSKGVGRA